MAGEASHHRLAGRLGALHQHARHDGRVTTAPGRAAFLSRFEAEVDPDGDLPAEERGRRAAFARRAYFTGLALRSARARRRATSSAPPPRGVPTAAVMLPASSSSTDGIDEAGPAPAPARRCGSGEGRSPSEANHHA